MRLAAWMPVVGVGLTMALVSLGLLSFLTTSGGTAGLVTLLSRLAVLGLLGLLLVVAVVEARRALPSDGIVVEHRDVRTLSMLTTPLLLWPAAGALVGAPLAAYEGDLVGGAAMLGFAAALGVPAIVITFLRRRVTIDPSTRTYTIAWMGPMFPIHRRRRDFGVGSAMLIEELPARRGTIYRLSVGADGASPTVLYDSPNGADVRDLARRIEAITGWVAP